jgi:hypothetical protein
MNREQIQRVGATSPLPTQYRCLDRSERGHQGPAELRQLIDRHEQLVGIGGRRPNHSLNNIRV